MVKPDMRKQFGILFGFVAIFIVVIVSFGIMWKLYNKLEQKKENEEKRRLIEAGWGPKEGAAVGEGPVEGEGKGKKVWRGQQVE
jgi:hypothetical protein